MSIITEIGQVCRLILLFQKDIAQHKEALFHSEQITENWIWNYFIGGSHHHISSQHLYNFMHKHDHPISLKEAQTLCYRFSSYKNSKLSKDDLWQIFKPRSLDHLNTILQCRKKKQAISKIVQLNFKSIDFMAKIIEKTIEYENFMERMRENVFKCQQKFTLPQITPEHLQIYVSDYAKQIRASDTKLIISHIIKDRKNTQKTFYEFFIPRQIHVPETNPNEQFNKTGLFANQQWEGFKFAKNKSKLYKYGFQDGKKKKPIYLG